MTDTRADSTSLPEQICALAAGFSEHRDAYQQHTYNETRVRREFTDPFKGIVFKYITANFNKLGLKKLICTSYDGSPLAGQMKLFDEYNAGNGLRKRPKANALIVDHVTDEGWTKASGVVSASAV